MKRFLLSFFTLVTVLVVSACVQAPKYDIVVSGYVPYDFVRSIVGDKLSYGMILRPGVEAHGFEPTPQNIITINNAMLFVYLSDLMEPWAEGAIESKNTKTILLDLSHEIDFEAGDPHHHDVAFVFSNQKPTLLSDHDHDHDEDPHYWVDLIIAMQMVDILVEAISAIDPTNAAFYHENGEALHEALHDLHHEIEEYMESILEANRIIYHAGHVNLAFFAARYHMEVISLTEAYAPDGQPTAPQIANMINALQASGRRVLFYEELANNSVAKTIQTELQTRGYSIQLLLFHGMHNVSQTDFNNQVTYLDIMEANFQNLKTALDAYVIEAN